MTTPVTGTVNFEVNVRTEERDGHWAAITRETAIATYGETEDEALRINAAANERLVKSYKEFGEAALAEFMNRMGISYAIDGKPSVKPIEQPSNDRVLAVAA